MSATTDGDCLARDRRRLGGSVKVAGPPMTSGTGDGARRFEEADDHENRLGAGREVWEAGPPTLSAGNPLPCQSTLVAPESKARQERQIVQARASAARRVVSARGQRGCLTILR